MNQAAIELDPALEELRKVRGDMFAQDLDLIPLEEALAKSRNLFKPAPPPPNAEDVNIAGYQGAPIRVRIYRPNGESAGLPIVMHLHGGGFVSGSIELDDRRCQRIAERAHCVVASVAYRLAPEHPFPTAIEDAFAVWTELTRPGNGLDIDHRRAAISGTSAGGHLAVAVAILARDRGAPMPRLQLLVYPVIDPGLDTGSYEDFRDGPFMTKMRMAWYWKQYRSKDGSGDPQLWAPLTADLHGLPPAHIITAEYDVLRDEAETYAAHLRKAGIKADYERYKGMVHGFVTMLPDHPSTMTVMDTSVAALRCYLDKR